MKLPLIKNGYHFPKKSICPWCKKAKIFEPNSMAILSGGSFLFNRKKSIGKSSKRMQGFLSLMWHGAHNGGKGKDKNIDVYLDVAKNVVGGQFEIYTCSTECLRNLLNSIVDSFEEKISKEKKRNDKLKMIK